MKEKSLSEMTSNDIKEAVKEKYSQVISKIRNARTGHKLTVCANIRSYKI